MPAPSENLAASLQVLQELQQWSCLLFCHKKLRWSLKKLHQSGLWQNRGTMLP